MNLAVSNFAWEFSEIENIGELLNKNNINHVEVVFPKYKSWSDLNGTTINELKSLLNENKLHALSSQSLFYGIDCKSIVTESDKFINHVKTLIEFSKIMGIKTLVFGSPGLRKSNDLLESNLHETFRTIDEMLDGTEITFCIEPNASTYGGDFFYTIKEIVHFLKSFNFKNIFTMCDTHNSWLENKDPNEELKEFKDYIKHIHVSEPKLVPIDNIESHKRVSQTLKEIGYDGIITYELNKCDDLEKTIQDFQFIYN